MDAPQFQDPKEGSIIAISACYYAAKGTGIAKETAVTSEEVVRTFTARKATLVEAITAGTTAVDKKVAQELANMILQTQVFKRLTHPSSKVGFPGIFLSPFNFNFGRRPGRLHRSQP